MNEDYLEHHGILGQRWGIRRYQNPDGTLTEKGRKRLQRMDEKLNKYKDKELLKSEKKWNKTLDRYEKQAKNYQEKGKDEKYNNVKTSILISQTMKDLENKSIKDLTYDRMQKEKLAIGANAAASALSVAGTFATIHFTKKPLGFVYLPNNSLIKTSMRVSDGSRVNAIKNAYKNRKTPIRH